MAQDLSTFTVRLDFNEEGEVAAITYEDLVGCGEEHALDMGSQPDMTVLQLVRYHLDHYDQNHNVRPRVRCGYAIRTEPFAVDLEPRVLRCTHEVHSDEVKHRFEMDA
jgi:hypothetical protein